MTTQTIEKTDLKWIELGQSELTMDSLKRLFRNEIPFIRYKQFAREDELLDMLDELNRLQFSTYEDVVPSINRIGCTVFEYDKKNKNDYFESALKNAEIRDAIFLKSFDPLRRIFRHLSEGNSHNVGIATNDLGEPYYAGLFRKIEQGTELHIDFAPAEHMDWEVCEIKNQLAWNLYLTTGEKGSGRTTIYQRQWKAEDQPLKQIHSYGFEEEVVLGSNSITFQPEPGELVIFNTKNYHIVQPSKGSRITVTSAIGEKPCGNVIFWS